MRRIVVLIGLALVLVSCSPESDVTGSTNKCESDLFPSYDSKDLKQCVAACIKCQNGVTTTCSTSCTLKGAR
jgi:PBP1b-binding outer membrane lipoprotein LpoB